MGTMTTTNPTLRKLKDAAKSMLPAPLFLSLLHHKYIGRYPNLLRPTTFNEKILQKSLRPDPWLTELTDKLTVRDYVARKLGESHLIPLLAAPETFTKEVFDAVPDSFVMKANHGSTYVKVVRNKSATSFEELRDLANHWMSLDFYKIGREKHYRPIKPRIFFEQLLLDESGNVPPDYKLQCFGAKSGRLVIYILVISDRFGADTRGDLYDVNWNHLDVVIGEYKPSENPPPRPDNLDAIVDAGIKLSADFDYVRVDLYSPNNQIYFGELTFTPGAGVLPFMPDRIDYEWGSLIPDAYLSIRPSLRATSPGAP
ncbi:ATP-grasp fold amidoligase family protein [Paraburkholderia sp. UCT70]|uniref:ATP-grasp fold amidoligase family protein n=1 Tax=Paraburkholderia sp. UCT70 TaxID=2991068 RepID=UPI003D24CA38